MIISILDVNRCIGISCKEYHPTYWNPKIPADMPHSIEIFCLHLCKIFHVFLFKHICLFHNISYNCIHFFSMGYAKKSKHNKDV